MRPRQPFSTVPACEHACEHDYFRSLPFDPSGLCPATHLFGQLKLCVCTTLTPTCCQLPGCKVRPPHTHGGSFVPDKKTCSPHTSTHLCTSPSCRAVEHYCRDASIASVCYHGEMPIEARKASMATFAGQSHNVLWRTAWQVRHADRTLHTHMDASVTGCERLRAGCAHAPQGGGGGAGGRAAGGNSDLLN